MNCSLLINTRVKDSKQPCVKKRNKKMKLSLSLFCLIATLVLTTMMSSSVANAPGKPKVNPEMENPDNGTSTKPTSKNNPTTSTKPTSKSNPTTSTKPTSKSNPTTSTKPTSKSNPTSTGSASNSKPTNAGSTSMKNSGSLPALITSLLLGSAVIFCHNQLL